VDNIPLRHYLLFYTIILTFIATFFLNHDIVIIGHCENIITLAYIVILLLFIIIFTFLKEYNKLFYLFIIIQWGLLAYTILYPTLFLLESDNITNTSTLDINNTINVFPPAMQEKILDNYKKTIKFIDH